MIDALILDFEQTESGADRVATDPHLGPRVDLLGQYDLDRLDLARYRGLLIGLHADQRYLQSRHAQIEAFLGGGGVVVLCGHVAHPFLAELHPYRPIPDYTLADLAVRRVREHPVWDGVAPEDLTWRRGVAGFRGCRRLRESSRRDQRAERCTKHQLVCHGSPPSVRRGDRWT